MPAEDFIAPTVRTRDRTALQTLNFFMADMEAGIGPFLGVLLASRGWHTGTIGTVITLGAIVGMVAVAPAGALVDATTRKRACVIGVGLAAVAASAVILTNHYFWVVAAAQAVMSISGAAIAPAVTASRSAWSAKRGSPARSVATRPSTTPATWPVPAWAGCWVGCSATPACSG